MSYILKCIIIGDQDTGKSCILRQFVEKKFTKKKSITIGVDFGSKNVNINNKDITFQIWDTAGQEKFRSVTRSYYRGAVVIFLVYSITCRESFADLKEWLKDAKTYGKEGSTIVVVGNKSDRRNERQVTLLEGSSFAQENGLLFMETSAATGDCIDEVFFKAGTVTMNKIADSLIDPTIDVHTPIIPEDNYCVC